MKQPRQDRAKQFMPFAALRGFEEMVKEKNELTSERRELSEDEAEKISGTLSRVKKGDRVSVTHYLKDRYVTTDGIVASFDPVFRSLTVVKVKVKFDDILSIQILFPYNG